MNEDPEQMKLTLIEKEISESFVVDEHIKAIGMASKMMGFAVSFRQSGEATIKRLKDGAATKGHDNLEKTIKLSSLKAVYGDEEVATDMLKKLEAAEIDGYAGHWKKNRLIGIHLGPDAQDDNKLKAQTLPVCDIDGKEKGHYYPINMDDLEASLAALKTIKEWKAIPVTGDYDCHDMIHFTGQPGIVSQGTEFEEKYILAINDAVAAIDSKRPADQVHKRVVQHGPQQNYLAYRLNQESSRDFVESVARPSFPLAMVFKGAWSVIKDDAAHAKFFRENFLHRKSTWVEPERLVPSGDGTVRLRRSSSLGSLASASSIRERAKDVSASAQPGSRASAPDSAKTAGLERAANVSQSESHVSQETTNQMPAHQPATQPLDGIPEGSMEDTVRSLDPLPHDLVESSPS